MNDYRHRGYCIKPEEWNNCVDAGDGKFGSLKLLFEEEEEIGLLRVN
jgi:hypothetical protein